MTARRGLDSREILDPTFKRLRIAMLLALRECLQLAIVAVVNLSWSGVSKRVVNAPGKSTNISCILHVSLEVAEYKFALLTTSRTLCHPFHVCKQLLRAKNSKSIHSFYYGILDVKNKVFVFKYLTILKMRKAFVLG
jgi:hypothetical protein